MGLSPRILGFLVAAITLAVDQGHKIWMLDVFDIAARQPVALTPFLDLVMAWNPGISYSLLSAETREGRLALLALSLGATLFLVPLPHPAIRITRLIDSMDASFTGGHAEIAIDKLRLLPSDILGEVGKGFRYAQVRLAPARLTHCMRWLGAAQRAHDIAVTYANERTAFGMTIGQHQGIGFQLADNFMDLHVARLVTRHAAAVLDQGHKGSLESSRAKVIVSEALYRVADRCVQVLGGMGLTTDTAIGQIFRELRAFRIYDGPSEVHRWSMARKILSASGVKA